MYQQKDIANGTREYTFKILMLGDSATGKTSLLTRLKTNTFSKDVKSTVGVDFVLKDIKWDSKTLVHLQLWVRNILSGNVSTIFFRFRMLLVNSGLTILLESFTEMLLGPSLPSMLTERTHSKTREFGRKA